jgi:hypothetical protein
LTDDEEKRKAREAAQALEEQRKKLEERERGIGGTAIRKGGLCPHGRIRGDCWECAAGR